MSDKPKHGELGTREWSHCRWCEVHDQYHGILHSCPSYPQEVLDKINNDSAEFTANLGDKDWIDNQIKNGIEAGVSPEDTKMAIMLMRFFSGQ